MKVDNQEQDRIDPPTQLPTVAPPSRTVGSNVTVERLILVMAIAMGAFLRLWDINGLGYNSDEAVYAGQGAAIAQAPVYKDIFPVFRAHPLLFQFILALVFQSEVVDVNGRLVSVAIGLATVYLVYLLGKLLYGPRAGAVAALLMALMPYHVVVTRQVLLDGPMVFCTTLTLYLLAQFAMTEKPVWLHTAGIGMGLSFLAKETAIILVGAVYAFLALSREIRVRLLDLALSLVFMAIMIAPVPLSLMLAGGTTTGRNYLVWQLFRRPNHTWDFYPTTVPAAIGLLVVALALLGLWVLRHERSWRERLLIWWILVPVAFFQLWPTKGFQYLLPIAPAVALLAARTLTHWQIHRNLPFVNPAYTPRIKTASTAIVGLSIGLASWQAIQPPTTGTFIAGSGGVPGGREAGVWVSENIPEGATLLTVGPSMANILQFYGHRKAYGLSVSPNPLRRNPSYQPVINPDLQIRNSEIQYLVWDSYSAERSSFFSDGLLRLARRFHGRVIHTESVLVTLEDGTQVAKPVIVIYEVRP